MSAPRTGREVQWESRALGNLWACGDGNSVSFYAAANWGDGGTGHRGGNCPGLPKLLIKETTPFHSLLKVLSSSSPQAWPLGYTFFRNLVNDCYFFTNESRKTFDEGLRTIQHLHSRMCPEALQVERKSAEMSGSQTEGGSPATVGPSRHAPSAQLIHQLTQAWKARQWEEVKWGLTSKHSDRGSQS